jgi:hypothetical protein
MLASACEQDGHGLANIGGDGRSATPAQTHGQKSAQNPTAIHREGRQEVEGDQNEVQHYQPLPEGTARHADFLYRSQAVGGRQPHQKDGRNDHVHRRSSQRDPEFLHRFLRHLLQARNAANGQQGDVARLDTVTARHQGVPQFMQDHAAKQGDNEGNAPQRGRNVLIGAPVNEPQKSEQQQKREVEINVNAEQFAELERPFHSGTICFVSGRRGSRAKR